MGGVTLTSEERTKLENLIERLVQHFDFDAVEDADELTDDINAARAILAREQAGGEAAVDLRERFADQAHAAWSGWMRYLFAKCEESPWAIAGDTEFVHAQVIPPALVQRWKRQMTTPYADLPESEKESDRSEADRYLALLPPAPPPAPGMCVHRELLRRTVSRLDDAMPDADDLANDIVAALASPCAPAPAPTPVCDPLLWEQQRKCCPDCQHGGPVQAINCEGCGSAGYYAPSLVAPAKCAHHTLLLAIRDTVQEDLDKCKAVTR